MHVYSFSDLKQNFLFAFEQAVLEGCVQINGEDGQVFILTSISTKKSPLDVKSVPLDLTANEIVKFIREGRK
jgi:hypothetical protein